MNDKTKEELKAESIKAERDSIQVTTGKATDNEEVEKEVEKEEPTNDEKGLEESGSDDEIDTDTEKEIEASEKTEEQLETEKQEAKTTAEKARVQKRIDKVVARAKAAETELAELKKQLAAKASEDGAKFTKEDVEAEAKRIADEKINEREFTNACNRLADGAKKLDKEFDKKIQALSEDVAPLPGYMIGILDDIDNGAQVLKHFADNQDVYEDIYTLNPVKMATAINKLSFKLMAEAKPKPKPISKVPPPNDPVNGGVNTSIVLNDKDPMEDWVKKRNAQVAQRNAMKLAGMR